MNLTEVTFLGVLLLIGRPQVPEHASVCGKVVDPSGASIRGAGAQLRGGNGPRNASSDDGGQFCFEHVEPGRYELRLRADGFKDDRRALMLQPSEAANLTIRLVINSVTQQVTVAEGSADTSSLNVAETQISSGLIHNLPSESVNAAMSSILTLATPGVAADSNGVFHPLGEHAETSFSVDGQPISDQQSRIFSNQISLNTIQEMRAIQGAPPAAFGDKTSLIVEATTRSGLGAGTPVGTLSLGYGSFRSPTASATLTVGNASVGNFLAADGINGRRFLDAPEFHPLHAAGNAQNIFDRFDWKPGDDALLHVNVSAERSWFQVPNTYDQEAAGQDQRQQMTSFNVGLAFSRVLRPTLWLTANTWARQDRVHYYPSSDVFSDLPATLSQTRRLASAGARSDVAYARGRHEAKAGIQFQVTPISESFRTGLTDPAFNSPCIDVKGILVPNASLTSTTACASSGFSSNIAFQPALLPYDLTRVGSLFQFRGTASIYEGSAYAQDSLKLGSLNLNLGIRYDNYAGLSSGSGLQPRAGLAFRFRRDTILHLSYARIFLTPYNENLVLSSSTGAGGLANGSLGATSVPPLTPARRNQFNLGFEHKAGSKLTIQGEYFWKFTRGAYDFNTILNTPLNFPIQFHKAKIDGAMARITLTDWHGLSAFTVLGHARSRLFSPEIGGINFGAAYAPVARPDHDQGFQQTTNLQYQFSRQALRGPWIGLTWRFDSGLVVVSVPDYATALTLTGDQQQQIGLFCGDLFATIDQPLRACTSSSHGATLIHIVPPGTYNADTNPTRIAPHSLFDLALGSEHLWKTDRYSIGGKITVVNLSDKTALYNFLSSFSGTHFVTPRTVQGELTFRF